MDDITPSPKTIQFILLTFISFIYTWDYYDSSHISVTKNYEKLKKKIVIFENFDF